MSSRSTMLAWALWCVTALTLDGIVASTKAANAAPQHTTYDILRTTMTTNRPTMAHDLKTRSLDIHWPDGFSPDQADLFSHNELRIEASCERVWKHIVEATKWPLWYPNSKEVRVLGGTDELQPGGIFRWTTFGLPLESRINEFTPFSRIGWYGYAPGERPSFYHTWYLVGMGGSCRVVTDEVGRGTSAARLRETDESLMHRGHDLWLATLKWVAESK
jgi:uncharacterized protein YndB with AHSA1/START domain